MSGQRSSPTLRPGSGVMKERMILVVPGGFDGFLLYGHGQARQGKARSRSGSVEVGQGHTYNV